MDNIVRPDLVASISEPFNPALENERCGNLLGVLDRLLTKITNMSDEEEEKGVEELNKEKEDVEMKSPDKKENRKDHLKKGEYEGAKTTPIGDGDMSSEEASEKDILTLIEEIDAFSSNFLENDVDISSNVTTENRVIDTEQSKILSKFELSDILTETPEMCFDFSSIINGDDDHSFEFDFDKIINGPESDKKKAEKIKEVSKDRSDRSPSKINYEPCSSSHTLTSLTAKLNETPSTSPRVAQTSGIETNPIKLPITPDFINDSGFPSSKSKLTSNAKTSKTRKIIFPNDVKIKLSDKMEKFLVNMPRMEDSLTKKKQESPPVEKSVADTPDTYVSNFTCAQSESKRITLPPRNRTPFQGYERKAPNVDEKKTHLQTLMEAYYVSRTDYKSELKQNQAIQGQNRNDVDISVPDDVIMTSDIITSLPQTTNNSTIIDIDLTVEDSNGTASGEGTIDFGIDDMEFGDKDIASNADVDDTSDNVPYSKHLLGEYLEKRFQAQTFTGSMEKFMREAPKPSGVCQLPAISRLLESMNVSKRKKINPATAFEKLNCEVRRAKKEEIMKQRVRDCFHVEMDKDFMMFVSVFQPVEKDYISSTEKRPLGAPKLAVELKALGTTTLSDLCGNFLCSNNFIGLKELSHPKYYSGFELLKPDTAKEMLPTESMLINDTVYCHKDKGIDSGNIIGKWAKGLDKGVGPFQCGNLGTTQIKYLESIRFGFPYVYIHLGSCEHVIVFNKQRRITKEDSLDVRNYPMIKNHIDFQNIYCHTHKTDELLKNVARKSKAQYLARYAVVDCDRLPHNPMLFCRNCVDDFCYDKKGSKIGNFKLFPFMPVSGALKTWSDGKYSWKK